MRAWLRRAWRAIELFLTLRDLAGLIVGLAPWVLVAAVLAVLASLRWLTSDPANAIAVGFIVLLVVYLAAVVARAELRKTVPIELEMLTGPGPSRVAIRNRSGRSDEFYAKARLVARRHDRGGQPLKSGSYVVPWEHSSGERVRIGNGDSETIVVGRFQLWHAQALAQMDVPQVTGAGEGVFETSRWNMNPDEKLPEYDVELSVYSPSYPRPHIERFTMRPARFTGPLELLATSQ